MLKSNNTKLTAVLAVAVFATLITLGPTTSNFQNAFAHYGVDIDQCKDDEDYYEDNEKACDKDLRLHYGEDYDGDFGSKTIDDDESLFSVDSNGDLILKIEANENSAEENDQSRNESNSEENTDKET